MTDLKSNPAKIQPMKPHFITGKLPPNFQALGYISLIIGFIFLLTHGVAGAICLFVGILILSIWDGVIFNQKRHRYKEYTSVLFIRFGKWKKILPDAEIHLYRTQESQVMSVASITRQDFSEVYKLFLVQQEKETELSKGDKTKMIKRAKNLAETLTLTLILNEE